MSGFHVSYDALEPLLKEILTMIKPLEEDYLIRVRIINEFRAVVESVESLTGATVEPFGSFVSNLYSKWGDLDISIAVTRDSLVSSVGKKHKQNILRDIQSALWRIGGTRILKFIPNARVPILIFESNHRNISCDISIGNLLGQVKSKLFLWITEMDERFRDMVLLVKEWAKAQNINDPKTGTLNSYSLCLLVIFHFQTCDPALLPPLKEIYAGNIGDNLTGSRVIVERNIQNTCAANIARFRSDRSRTINHSSLLDLFVSFFEKFSTINRMASDFVICTYTGKWEPIRSNTRWMVKTFPLHIEDPFEQTENASRAVGRSQLIRILEAFVETSRLLSANLDTGSVIENLVRRQIRSQFVTRTSRGGYSGAHSRGGPNLGRRPYNGATPLPNRNPHQIYRPDSHNSSVSFNRAGSSIRSQSRQEWRPRYT